MIWPFFQYATLLSWKSKGAKTVGRNCLFCVMIEQHEDPNCKNSCIINNPRRTDTTWVCVWSGEEFQWGLQNEFVNEMVSHTRLINTEG